MREPDYDGFASEVEFRAYLAELEMKKRKHAARSPEAIRQDRCRARRRRVEKYWEVFLKTGGKPTSFLVDKAGLPISDPIIQKAKADMVSRFPEYAKLRGLV